MARNVHCVKLGREAEGLDFPPLPGEIGQRIFERVSKQAWQEWLAHQTMLINENRLDIRAPESRRFLSREMEKHLFGGGSEKPAGYVAPE